MLLHIVIPKPQKDRPVLPKLADDIPIFIRSDSTYQAQAPRKKDSLLTIILGVILYACLPPLFMIFYFFIMKHCYK